MVVEPEKGVSCGVGLVREQEKRDVPSSGGESGLCLPPALRSCRPAAEGTAPALRTAARLTQSHNPHARLR